MHKRTDLIKEIDSLDMVINALTVELAEQLDTKAQSDQLRKLVGEITEALDELRLARGVRKLLLSAYAGSSTAVEKKINNRISRRSSVKLSPAA
jgi:hypothetical protein